MKNNFWGKFKRPILALAPMAGFTDSAFRRLCKKYGADVVYSEMASVSALFFKPEKTLELVKFKKAEAPYVVQLFGKNPEHFKKAARIISEKVRPHGIDINFGCPVKKIFKEGSGCALMLEKKSVREIIQAVLENTHLPVSIKIRSGVKSATAIELIEYINDLDFKAVMIHGRTYEQGFSGASNFDMIAEIKKLIPEKIVLANGGIDDPEEARKILENYPEIDGLGIARGALGKPFIFKQIKDLWNHGKFREYDLNKTKKIMLIHSKFHFMDKKKIFDLRKHLFWYAKNFPGASELRRKLVGTQSFQNIKDLLK